MIDDVPSDQYVDLLNSRSSIKNPRYGVPAIVGFARQRVEIIQRIQGSHRKASVWLDRSNHGFAGGQSEYRWYGLELTAKA